MNALDDSDERAASRDVVDDRLGRALDDLAIAVDRLFVEELRQGLADEHTLDLVATARDLALVTRTVRSAVAEPEAT